MKKTIKTIALAVAVSSLMSFVLIKAQKYTNEIAAKEKNLKIEKTQDSIRLKTGVENLKFQSAQFTSR